MRIDLIGTSSDFRRFWPPHPLHVNHLLRKNSRAAGRIGEVRLGDTVNVAARLEQETKAVGLRLVVSRNFLAAAGETVDGREWQPLGSRTLRGRARRIDLLGAQPFQQRSANDE